MVSRVGSRTIEVRVPTAIPRAVESLSTLEATGACVVVAAIAGEGGAVARAVVAIAPLEVAVRGAVQATVGGDAALARAIESAGAGTPEAAGTVRWR